MTSASFSDIRTSGVEDVVKVLLEESAPLGPEPPAAELAPEFYYGGARRPTGGDPALSAAAMGDPKQQGDPEQRARAILALKEVVDVLLERQGLDQSVLRVPMRMLTTALVAEMESTVAQKGKQREIEKGAQLLLRAIPSRQWLDALEPSVATRADKACVAIATIADETDIALTLLADAVRRTPDQAIAIADAFLETGAPAARHAAERRHDAAPHRPRARRRTRRSPPRRP